jgi:Domain of unknown function (DUF3854)
MSTSYPNSRARTLSNSHSRELKDSDIAPHVSAARGYRTIRHRSEVPDEFAKWQRRLGLLVPTHSTDKQTKGHQLKPNKPIPRKNGSVPKYETPTGSRITLDVNPLMLEEVRAGDGDLWVTEGPKKVDALTSRGEPTVGIIGVWNFAEPGSKSKVPLACWNHVRLRGRRVIIVYDADARTNPDVQEALRRLVTMLEALGATVLVAYLPVVNGDDKAGVDDYLAGGGTVAELRLMAAPYQPVDVGAERMSRDEKLRAVVEDLERRWWDEEWKGRGGHTDRDLALKLIEAASRSGKIHADGLRVKVSWGKLQVGAKVARRTLAKAIGRLEQRGFMYRDNEGRKPDKTGAFVLVAKVDQEGRAPAPEGNVTPELQTCGPGSLPSQTPRLRWTRPKYTPRRGLVSGTRRARKSKPLPPRDRIERLGKIRGAVVDALEVAGGALTLAQLCEVLHRARPYDLVRRKTSPKGYDGPLIMLEAAGIVAVEGDTVALAADWSERLEAARRIGGELEADELAEGNRKRKSRDYHRRHEPPKFQPSAVSIAAVEVSREKRRAYLDAHAGDQAANTPSDDELVAMRRRVEQRVREGMARRFAEQEVYGAAASCTTRPDPPTGPPDDPMKHPLACECLDCSARAPSYARTFGGAA